MRAVASFCLVVILSACTVEDPASERRSPEELVGALSDAAVVALRDRDFLALSRLVHPVSGVRFSPYGFVDVSSDKLLTADELAAVQNDESRYSWGSYDGSGEPISMTFGEYYERFVYDADYKSAEQTSVNGRLGVGNSINNAAEIYPGCITVEYHFSGFDPALQGLDWRSLRLVFSRHVDEWYLVGIVHDEWTT